MKLTAAIGALFLAASAGPAFAGYWDGVIVQAGPGPGPPPAASAPDGDPNWGRDCACHLWRESDDGDVWLDDRGWLDQDDAQSGAYLEQGDLDDGGVEVLDNGDGFEPGYFVVGGGRNMVFGFARAGAFARASASSTVDVDIDIDGRGEHHHYTPPYHPPPRMGGWGQMQGHQAQPHYGARAPGGGYRR